jgi:REP element-mobilizing transposase RayT
MGKELPKRKPNRLNGFDYGAGYAYFITICTQNREKILSNISSVGEGLAPPEMQTTKIGKIVEEQLLLLENRFSNLKIENYVIMPNHIHIIFSLLMETGGASPSPTIPNVVCAFKSQCVRELRKIGYEGKLWQRSYHDHVIRNKTDYEEVSRYIYENPINWETDEFYTK